MMGGYTPPIQPPATPTGAGNLADASKVKFERNGSTYTLHWWSQNDPDLFKHKKLVGYSKPVGQSEPDDKQYLLKSIIRRFRNNGYFSRMARLDVYRNFSDENVHSQLFLTMWRNHYQLHMYGDQVWLVQYLNEFYQDPTATYGDQSNPFPTKQPKVYDVMTPVNGLFPKQTMDDIRKVANNIRFQNVEQYSAYIKNLEHQQYPPGMIKEFTRILSNRENAIKN